MSPIPKIAGLAIGVGFLEVIGVRYSDLLFQVDLNDALFWLLAKYMIIFSPLSVAVFVLLVNLRPQPPPILPRQVIKIANMIDFAKVLKDTEIEMDYHELYNLIPALRIRMRHTDVHVEFTLKEGADTRKSIQVERSVS